MKHLFFLMILLSGFVFAGERGGNGGDPYEIYAQNFPDQVKLNDAIEMVIKKVGESKYPDDFKSDLYGEILSLKNDGKFLYLGNVVIIPENPQGLSRFTAFGAITGKNKGDNVYFSERSLKHPGDVFATLLLHEVLHHVVLEVISDDEAFIEDLAQSIMKGTQDKRLEIGIDHAVYLKKNSINGVQLLNYYLRRLESNCKHDCDTYKKRLTDSFVASLNLSSKNNFNVMHLPTLDLSYAISKAGMSYVSLHLEKAQIDWAHEGVPLIMIDLFHNAGLNIKWNEYLSFHCKSKPSWTRGCKAGDQLKMSEVVEF